MDYSLIIIILVAIAIVAAVIYGLVQWFDKDRVAQRELDAYLKKPLNGAEVGRLYERYIGHLYETKGYDVVYHGAVNGYGDLGRDLIVNGDNEIHVIQTKCWAKYKQVPENHIFQLYGSVAHYKLTSKESNKPVKAVFYTTARYSDIAREVASVLGVEVKTEELDRTYPMIKCNVSDSGEKIYHLPFDKYYDKVKIEPRKGEFFAKTVKEAVAQGFRRSEI